MAFNFGQEELNKGQSTKPRGVQRGQLEYPLDLQSTEAIRRALETTRTFKTIQLEPGEDIQETIDKLDEEGGGTVLLAAGTYNLKNTLTSFSKVNLIGAGRQQTIIDFGDNDAQILYEPSGSESFAQDFTISDLTVQNTASSDSILKLDSCQFFRITNVRLRNTNSFTASGTGHGLRLVDCGTYILENVFVLGFGSGSGFRIEGETSLTSADFSLINCRAQENNYGYFFETTVSGGTLSNFTVLGCYAVSSNIDGFRFAATNGAVSDYVLVGCVSDQNSGDGYEWVFENNPADATVTGCLAASNTGEGFEVGHNDIALVGCQADSNGDIGFQIRRAFTKLVACSAVGNTTNDYSLEGTAAHTTLFLGNSIDDNNTTDNPLDKVSETDTPTYSAANIGGSHRIEKRISRVLNGAGDDLSAGDVVILKSTANGNEVDFTTTAGDNKVWGMVLDTITDTVNDDFGNVLMEGYTEKLRVDGTTDIAIGDYLSTHTSAGRAQKASSGHMAFAIALEAYTTDDGNGVINALLIKPRLI